MRFNPAGGDADGPTSPVELSAALPLSLLAPPSWASSRQFRKRRPIPRACEGMQHVSLARPSGAGGGPAGRPGAAAVVGRGGSGLRWSGRDSCADEHRLGPRRHCSLHLALPANGAARPPVHRAAISLHPVAHLKGSSHLIGGWCTQVHVYYGHDYCPPISTFTRVPERLLSSAGKSFEPGGYSASVAIPIARC